MVGVPGRSQSCITCLGRKKGCDKQQPTCTQCDKAGLTCGGYGRARVFVNRAQAGGHASTPYRTIARSTATSAPDITLPFSLTQTAYNLRYVDLFWSAYLPGGKAFTADAMKLSIGGWINVAQDLYPTDRSLQLAMKCVSLCGVGTLYSDESLMKQGLAAYTRCMQELNQALRDPKRLKHDGILCTAKLLSLFEMHYGADDTDPQAQYRSWIAHAKGQLAILGARQPQEFRSGKAHQLFSDYRYILVISAVGERKRFVIKGKGWKTIPWKSNRKSPRDKLLDILGDLAGVLEDIDNIDNCENERIRDALGQHITRSCWSLDGQLQSWIYEVGALKNFQNPNGGSDVLGPRDPQDFALAHLTILYWATCTLLYANLLAFADSTTEMPARVDPFKYARELTLALPFFFQPSAAIMGPKAAAFPLGLVMQVLCGTERTPSEHRVQLRRYFQTQGEGKNTAKFLMSLQRGSGSDGIGVQGGSQSVQAKATSWMNLKSRTAG
ncbi:hypothetical protein FZEAL_4566 [Fusarium zealandicum]|uniref:Zn(2)-C6 fungal-type domain-containing protein n=1 Tax=Fusarium zealandicum TaxID=1053134 RepID=A0A8H4XLG4_9HYPO|nr:hypothetical protein FZEAL_4566 [Fusarium zealandicum]